MNISYAWLREYIQTDLPAQELAAILTSIGLEVELLERVQAVRGGLEGVVVGHVLSCQKHPDADRLSLTTVDIGAGEPLPIVCGAPNVAAGQKVAVATIGTTLHIGDRALTLAPTKIRGQLSMGMICAEDELGLGPSHQGILVLDPSATPGTPAREYFGLTDDHVFSIGLTPNRIDAASHIGVARDLAAYLNLTRPTRITRPGVERFRVDNHALPIAVEVANPEACPRYSGVSIANVTVGPSPQWLQQRLKAIGLKPINNVVDVTNFVLHEVGQPLHAFDADRIAGRRVLVKTLPPDTPFVTLDGVERRLHPDDLMICDAQGGMCIAGVFGGAQSGVTEATRNIFLESACFHPVWVRRTARRHGLSTDSSFRFERGSDPNLTLWALQRAALLIQELAHGQIASPVVDIYPKPIEDVPVELPLGYLNRLIGNPIPADTVKAILTSLDIQVQAHTDDTLMLRVPPYRVDVQRPADVVEEVLRIYGYNNVEVSQRVQSTITHSARPNMHNVIRMLSESLSANGFHEIMCNSLTRKGYYASLAALPEERVVEIINPLSSDLNGLRQTLLFGGLEAILHNSNHRNPNLKLYEWGNCYAYQGTGEPLRNRLASYAEALRLGLWLTGESSPESWARKPERVTFAHLKGYLNALLERLGIGADVLERTEAPADLFHYGMAMSIDGKHLGWYGAVSPRVCQSIGIKAEVFFAEIDWPLAFAAASRQSVAFREIPRYPEVRRDLALLLDADVTYAQLRELALRVEPRLIRGVNLFDYYQAESLGAGKKSYALSFILQDPEATLTDRQVDQVMERMIGAFARELGAQIR